MRTIELHKEFMKFVIIMSRQTFCNFGINIHVLIHYSMLRIALAFDSLRAGRRRGRIRCLFHIVWLDNFAFWQLLGYTEVKVPFEFWNFNRCLVTVRLKMISFPRTHSTMRDHRMVQIGDIKVTES